MVKESKEDFSNRIRYVVMAVAVIVFCVAAGMLIHIFLEYKRGVDIYESIENSVITQVEKPTDNSGETISQGEAELPFVYNHEALLAINPEGVGYIYIPSIDVRLPIVKGSDNEYYLNHTFNKVYNGAGALFIDANITDGLNSTNVIIYGHNMKNGSMFAGLAKYQQASFFQSGGNDVFYIYTGNDVLIYKIFSAYVCEPAAATYTYNFSTVEGLRKYAQSMQQMSLYNTGTDVSSVTQVVTLSTCTSDGNNRIVVQGMYVGKQSQE